MYVCVCVCADGEPIPSDTDPFVTSTNQSTCAPSVQCPNSSGCEIGRDENQVSSVHLASMPRVHGK